TNTAKPSASKKASANPATPTGCQPTTTEPPSPKQSHYPPKSSTKENRRPNDNHHCHCCSHNLGRRNSHTVCLGLQRVHHAPRPAQRKLSRHIRAYPNLPSLGDRKTPRRENNAHTPPMANRHIPVNQKNHS